jgi:hypothetical protein
MENEFDRQIKNLLEKDYPKLAGIEEVEFIKIIEPLRKHVVQLPDSEVDLRNGYLPFVIVVNGLIESERKMSAVVRNGIAGVTILRPHTSSEFKTIDDEVVPESKAYLLIGVDRGKQNINFPPSEAMRMIRSEKRLPLTIEEGISIVTQYPDFLMKNNCFSLLASRTGSDQRVPAIWINAKKEPNLGWCWDGNPHTWLGSASCDKRIGY